MDHVAYALTADYEGTVQVERDGEQVEQPIFTGAVLAVGDGDFHVADALAEGGGTIVVQEVDQRLVDLLDSYPALKRVPVPDTPEAVVSPYERAQLDSLRHIASLRDIAGHGDSRANLVAALSAVDHAQADGDPELVERIQHGDRDAVAEAFGGEPNDGLGSLVKAQLVALAEARQVPLEDAATNAQIIDRLRAAGVRKED